MKRIGQLFGSLLVVLVLLGAVTTWWVMRPLTLTNPTVDISIEPQTTVRGIAQVVAGLRALELEPLRSAVWRNTLQALPKIAALV